MRKAIILILVMFFIQNLMTAQIPEKDVKIIKDFTSGKIITLREYTISKYENINKKESVIKAKSTVELVWEATEDAAIFEMVSISDETYQGIVNRELNYHGWGYYNESSSTPVWEYFSNDFERVPCDITSNGNYMAAGAGDTVYRFTPSSGIPDRTYGLANTDDEVYDLSISENGETVYFSAGSPCKIFSLNIETLTENWSFELPSGGWTQGMALSKNGEKLVIIQYGWVIVYSNTGNVLFQTEISAGSQTAPSISDDGNIVVTGDLEGNAIVYEYNSETETYDIKWSYLFEPEAYYDWARSVAVSGDGSTIALGSLHFDGEQNSGELAVFDTESNVPIWIYESVHEEISAIDITADGSIITAVSDGPLNDDDEDFWIFNKDNNVPFFEYNCQGSPIDVDISNDGKKCIVGGKAVHNSVMGNGGKLYYFDIDQGSDIENTKESHINSVITSFPNPFNSEITITYSLQQNSNVTIEIYDIQGKKIKTLVNEYKLSGNHSVVWNGTGETQKPAKSGIYFCRLKINETIILKKMILMK